MSRVLAGFGHSSGSVKYLAFWLSTASMYSGLESQGIEVFGFRMIGLSRVP